MNRRVLAISALIVSLTMILSCKQLFTTSLGSGLSRDSIKISDKTSISDLLNMALSSTGSDSEGAKAILKALGNKHQSDILSLSVADQTTILNLATTATVDMGSLSSLISDASKSGANIDQLIANSFDSSADLTAIETILGNTATVQTAPVDSIVLATVVVLANVANEIGSSTLANLLSQTAPDLSSYTAEQQKQINLIMGVADILDTRPAADTENVTMGNYKLTDLLKGNAI